jgi:hypothetical protein
LFFGSEKKGNEHDEAIPVFKELPTSPQYMRDEMDGHFSYQDQNSD